jgi:hypothetical protein
MRWLWRRQHYKSKTLVWSNPAIIRSRTRNLVLEFLKISFESNLYSLKQFLKCFLSNCVARYFVLYSFCEEWQRLSTPTLQISLSYQSPSRRPHCSIAMSKPCFHLPFGLPRFPLPTGIKFKIFWGNHSLWDFKFSRRRVWCSGLSSGMYCLWNVGRQSFYTAVYLRRQFWT